MPDLSSLDPHELRDYFADTHYATPMRALNLRDHIGTLPGIMRVLGWEPEELDGLSIGLSPATLASVDEVVAKIVAWIDDFLASDTAARRAAV